MAGRYESARIIRCEPARMSATAHVVLHRLGMPVAHVGPYGEVVAYAPNPSGGEREVVTVMFRDAGQGNTLVTVRSECRNVTLVTDWGRNKRHVRDVLDGLIRAVTVTPGPPPPVSVTSVYGIAPPPPAEPSAHDILMKRYIDGEIDLDEFERLQREILSEQP